MMSIVKRRIGNCRARIGYRFVLGSVFRYCVCESNHRPLLVYTVDKNDKIFPPFAAEIIGHSFRSDLLTSMEKKCPKRNRYTARTLCNIFCASGDATLFDNPTIRVNRIKKIIIFKLQISRITIEQFLSVIKYYRKYSVLKY